MRTDRRKDLDTYYNDHLKMRIISRLMEIKTWSEIMGIQSYVIEAGFREQKAQHAEQEEFKAWKKKKKIRKESDEEIEEEARLKDGDDELSWSK